MLHVHKGGPEGDHHHDGPAAHAHKMKVQLPPINAEVGSSDENSSAIPVALAKATASHICYLLAAMKHVAGIGAPGPSHVPQLIVTSLAHGPPASCSCSLRAPPQSLLL